MIQYNTCGQIVPPKDEKMVLIPWDEYQNLQNKVIELSNKNDRLLINLNEIKDKKTIRLSLHLSHDEYFNPSLTPIAEFPEELSSIKEDVISAIKNNLCLIKVKVPYHISHDYVVTDKNTINAVIEKTYPAWKFWKKLKIYTLCK